MRVLDNDTELKFPHVLVMDASAGSGKTHTLTQRFVQFILSDKIPRSRLTNMLAITFTNNAAREMKQRILEWLKKLALNIECEERNQTLELVSMSSGELSRKAMEAVENILGNYSDFHVQTIDSFMSKVLHSSAIELGLRPDVEITETHAVLMDYALSLMLKEVGESMDDALAAEIDSFLALLVREETSFPWRVREKINKTFSTFLSREGKALEEIAFEDKHRAARERLDTVAAVYDTLSNMGLGEKVKKSVQDSIRWKDVKALAEKYSPRIPRIKPSDETDQILEAWADLAPVVGEMAEFFSQSRYCHYGRLYERFKDLLNRVKREREIIHIDDINKALSTYISNETIPEIYYHLGNKLYHFLLDEFQDTDSVQWENMKPLVEESLSKEGSLFTVGDLKQAIYMFRNADYRIMREIVRAIDSEGYKESKHLPRGALHDAKVVRLEKNYCSSGVILEYVESVFRKKLKEQVGTSLFEEDRTGLTWYVQEPLERTGEDGYVKVKTVNAGDGNPEKDVLLGILTDVEQRFKYREIAILARTNSEIERIVEWLTERNMPAASYSSLDIRKRKVIVELTNLLRFLNSPVDNFCFAVFLSGDIFLKAAACAGHELSRGDIDDFLFRFSREDGRSPYLYVRFREDREFAGLWNDLIKDIYNKVGYYPIYDLISLIYRTFRVFDNFEEESGFFLKFLEAVSTAESRGMNNIKDLLEMISEHDEKSVFNVILPDYVDAVKVMTFHKSKGLGFPVVINLIYDRAITTDHLLFEKRGEDLRTYYVTKGLMNNSSRLTSLYAENLLDKKTEFLNCLYVANTRAKKELYNIVIRKDRNHNPFLDLFEDCVKGEKKPHRAKDSAKEVSPQEVSPQEPSKVLLPDEVDMEFKSKEKGDWSIERLLETKRGELFHEILSRIEFLEDNAEVVLDRLLERTLMSRKELYDAARIKKTILAFLGVKEVKVWFERRQGRGVYTEVEYSDEHGALHRLDRVITDPGRIIVIDFKTGEEERESYQTQLRNYVDLLKRLHPRKEVTGYLAFVDKMKIEELRTTNQDIQPQIAQKSTE
jgi:ATP-dependent exoDNAse (exonuclease V) beta subunit